ARKNYLIALETKSPTSLDMNFLSHGILRTDTVRGNPEILFTLLTAVGTIRNTSYAQELMAGYDLARAREYAKKYDHLVLISGRYEGIDARVKKILKAEEVSVGNYILTGGELPALTIIDAVSRHIPGVLGTHESLEDERATTGETYTRPEVFEYKKKKHRVPKVLVEGNHKQIEEFRKK
ncbi:MAG: hypothetical protein AAB388_00560, partial [Patescibacteria group bacterium]